MRKLQELRRLYRLRGRVGGAACARRQFEWLPRPSVPVVLDLTGPHLLERAYQESGDVESNAEVGGFLVPQHIDQHRGEPEDPIGVLTGLG